MDPLGSLQVCVYYVKQMNAFPLLSTKIMSALTGAGIINGALCATVQTHRVLRIGLSPLNAGPDEKSTNQILFVAKVSLFLSHSRSWKSLFNQDISLEMLEQSPRLGVTPETNTLEMFWPLKCL